MSPVALLVSLLGLPTDRLSLSTNTTDAQVLAPDAAGANADAGKVIIITPAGRRARLELLAHYVDAWMSAGVAHEWHLWENTREASDRDYLYELAKAHSYVKVIEYNGAPGAKGHNAGIGFFWSDPPVREQLLSATCVRFDDDVVWADSPEKFADFVKTVRDSAAEHPFVYANVLNNAVSTNFHQRYCGHFRALNWPWKGGTGYPATWDSKERPDDLCTDEKAWKDGDYAVDLHREVLRVGPSELRCPDKRIELDYRYSINAVGWHGPELRKYDDGGWALPGHNHPSAGPKKEGGGDVGEEEMLSVAIPRHLGKRNLWVGDFVVAHYSFTPQDEKVDAATDILEGYRALAGCRQPKDLATPCV